MPEPTGEQKDTELTSLYDWLNSLDEELSELSFRERNGLVPEWEIDAFESNRSALLLNRRWIESRLAELIPDAPPD